MKEKTNLRVSNKTKAIIFDFDGVLIDSFKFHQKKLHEFNNTNLSDEEYKKLHEGLSFDYANDKVKDLDWDKYREFIYDEFTSIKVDEKIKDTIVNLSEKYELFIVSSAGSDVIIGFLEKNGLLPLFKKILGYEFHFTKIEKFRYLFDTYDISNTTSVFVTDTLGDLLEANKVDLRTVAVDYGFHERERLLKGSPGSIISNLADLKSII